MARVPGLFPVCSRLALVGVISLLVGATAWAAPAAVMPFETEGAFVLANRIDEILVPVWSGKGVVPARPCSDAVFLRRAYLDLIGALPTSAQAEAFLDDPSPNKRGELVEKLFQRKEFADYWAMKWCDVLRVKAEFPINLWPNAVQSYHRWIRDSIKDNKPYDQFMRELLVSSGSNFRVPPVNFYRAMQGHEPSTIARCVGLTMMGTRVESWPEDRRKGFEAFFSRIDFKGTAEWKEEIVHLDPAAEGDLDAVFPDGQAVKIPSGTDPRRVFADWLIQPDSAWFARAAVNRTWFWLYGRGIVHEADDMREDNPPMSPELLDYLAAELVAAKYDMRHVLRLIVNSRTYQLSCVPQSPVEKAEPLFACYPVRRLDAEVLVDAFTRIFGRGESYSSPIPEPFTFIPENHRTVTLADGSITSQFLEMFGRPSRDTGTLSERSNTPTEGQSMHLLNSSHIQNKIEGGWGLKALVRNARGQRGQLLEGVYLTILSRRPTPAEQVAVGEYFRGAPANSQQGLNDLCWALVNSKEFLYRH